MFVNNRSSLFRHPLLMAMVMITGVTTAAVSVSSFDGRRSAGGKAHDKSVPQNETKAVVNPAPTAVNQSDSAAGTFKGVVQFQGQPPERELVFRKNDKRVKDPSVCAAEDHFAEELVINEKSDNGVANVVVYLKQSPKGYTAGAVPDEPAKFVAKGCRFVPHILIVRCDQTVVLENADPAPHSCRVETLRNVGITELMGPLTDTLRHKMSKPESVPISVKCLLHTWMNAYWLPLDHPFAAVTDADGKFEIKGLPPGEYDFTIWHEKPGYLNKALRVRIVSGKTTEKTLSYGLTDFIKP